ncbi:cwf19-like protein 2 [Phtheirospermum japonicum]|uniref:Cwf19-like protein 2 n=1 Tax=Phtheirospermum japonicum TaxID=374723 RepID=A0A830C9P3_9LAMI|nr:cwf19-like protein 2 [Phtheirospermum japonicum]
MLSGLKFIPRDQIDKEKDETPSTKETRKSGHRKEKAEKKKKHSRHSSSDDEGLERIKSGSRKKKKWYDPNEDMSSFSEESGSQSESERDRKKRKSQSKKKSKSRRRGYSSVSESSSSGSEREKSRNSDNVGSDLIGDRKGSQSLNSNNIVRKEMGLEWMLRPKDDKESNSSKASLIEPEEASVEEIKKDNPRELNPYLRNDGSGYPEDSKGPKAEDKRLLSNTVVGDGGASWRLKALKRAQEQAAREGRHLQEEARQKSTNDVTPRHPKMRVPKVHDSLSWGKRGNKNLSAEDNALVSSALSSVNKFSNDGNFLAQFMHKEENTSGDRLKHEARAEPISVDFASMENKEDVGTMKPSMTANQLAAKAMQLRMKGKHEEAEKLLKETETIKESQNTGDRSSRQQIDGTTSRVIMHDVSARQKKKEDDGDLHLAQNIMHNHRYSVSGQADEEYDYDGGLRKKNRKKGQGGGNHRSTEITNSAKRFLTQQDRCQFCFENPGRPKHLVIAIANFTYLALPQQQPHESSTRTVEDNVWDEIRNFKKCLIMMFAKQEKEVVFFETVMGLAQQRRHCMVECVPLPRDVAKQAPVYFKKAIDEAEDEWSQHNAKKLIDTSEKGLRGSIPKNFPYFHVEFGLNKGFVHVIDDEKEFKSSFGLNIIRGILRLPAEDMHRRRRQESFETQKQAVASFAQDWEPFDWTKQLD